MFIVQMDTQLAAGCDRGKVLLMSWRQRQCLGVVKPRVTYGAHPGLMPINCLCHATSRCILCVLHILRANYFRKMLKTFQEIICTVFHRLLRVKAGCQLPGFQVYTSKEILYKYYFRNLYLRKVLFLYIIMGGFQDHMYLENLPGVERFTCWKAVKSPNSYSVFSEL